MQLHRGAALDRCRRLMPLGINCPGHLRDHRPLGRVFLALRAVQGTPIRAGDLLMQLHGNNDPRALRESVSESARVIPVPRAAFGAILAHGCENFECIISSWDERQAVAVRQLHKKLHHVHKRLQSSGRDPGNATSPLCLIRELREEVTAPIGAATDDAAIFELVAQAGGRLTSEGA